MYLEHFGLNAPPFQFTASPMALFMSRTHREGLAALEWGLLHEPSGLTLLIGDSGTGKTTLVCALLARQYRDVRAAYLGNPKLSFMELLGSVLSQVGVRGGRASKGAMINAFAGFAADLPLNQRIAILIDEAQALSDDALEDFRLLSNLERHGRKAVQIVLAGQYELARRLGNPAMRHLNERIGARAVLVPLTPLECAQYIEHRLRLCGSSAEKIFVHRALEQLIRDCAGIPRRINALCHNALLLAYAAGAKRVMLPMVRQAAADYAGLDQPSNRNGGLAWLLTRFRQVARPLRPVLGLGLLGAAGFVSGEFLLNHVPLAAIQLRPAGSSAPAAAAAKAIAKPKTASASTAAPRVAAEKPGGGDALATLDISRPETPDPGSESGMVAKESSIIGDTGSAPGPVASTAMKAPKAADSGTAASPAASAPHPDSRFVIIAPGDTLGHIALRHLGSTSGVHRLMELNPQITNAARVYPGEVVYLPSSSVASPTGNRNEGDVE